MYVAGQAQYLCGGGSADKVAAHIFTLVFMALEGGEAHVASVANADM